MVYLTVLAVGELAVIVVLIWLRDRERDANAKLIADFNLAAERERDRLVSRIQRPELVPAPLGTVTQRPRPKDAQSLAAIGGFATQPNNE
jgi:hypothetical protein